MSALKHLRALLLPFTVTVIVPLLISSSQNVSPGWGFSYPASFLPIIVGIVLIGFGLALVVLTVRMIILIGKGTLAPWDPTQHLVVVGVYRHVRNPMISGVTTILLGEAVALGSVSLLLWCGLFLATNMIYIPLSEEPGLIRRFGDEYRAYQQNVPRWIPRLKPWIPDSDTIHS
jgi:protein-S-isoprenylcysteine O-methyltransferase Ste14